MRNVRDGERRGPGCMMDGLRTRVARELHRWWRYQTERFPLVAHGLLIAAFSSSTVCFSTLARGAGHAPAPKALLVAFATAFLFFLQLRIADEWKDHAEDCLYRPYRPVPRGLVNLRELRAVGLGAAGLQALLALWLSAALVPLLLLVWAYLALMSKEFFVRAWLKARPVAYMTSHMLILPLVDLYGTACDWRVAGVAAPAALSWLLLVSLLNGFGVEIGRKIRAPGDEERGVETYSMLWGRSRAVGVWLGALPLTAGCALGAARAIHFAAPAALLLAAPLLAATAAGALFLRRPATTWARAIERVSGAWTLVLYLSLGLIPLLAISS